MHPGGLTRALYSQNKNFYGISMFLRFLLQVTPWKVHSEMHIYLQCEIGNIRSLTAKRLWESGSI